MLSAPKAPLWVKLTSRVFTNGIPETASLSVHVTRKAPAPPSASGLNAARGNAPQLAVATWIANCTAPFGAAMGTPSLPTKRP